MIQELSAESKNASNKAEATVATSASPVSHNARIEALAKYMLSLRNELPDKPKPDYSTFNADANDTDNAA